MEGNNNNIEFLVEMYTERCKFVNNTCFTHKRIHRYSDKHLTKEYGKKMNDVVWEVLRIYGRGKTINQEGSKVSAVASDRLNYYGTLNIGYKAKVNDYHCTQYKN